MTDKDHTMTPGIRLPSGSNGDAMTHDGAASQAARNLRPETPAFFGETGTYGTGTTRPAGVVPR